MKHLLTALITTIFMTAGANVSAADPENTLHIELKDGTVVIEMYQKKHQTM